MKDDNESSWWGISTSKEQRKIIEEGTFSHVNTETTEIYTKDSQPYSNEFFEEIGLKIKK
ncbi:hypothetical protein C0583_04370 [Candidatus Parcubacteria bacterium]|nr:MAG: hypothetical protein C0583_04370 [Candidatus Parcubacteria bacterium]